jgi:hypothetical protein
MHSIRALSAMISWSIPRGYRSDNPCNHVRKPKGGEGYDPWSWERILHFREHVSRPELWWAAALATGKKLGISVHRDLRDVVVGIPRKATEMLTNTRGRPWTADGFRSSWGKELDRDITFPLHEAGLVFHGLRKSAVAFLLEAGCTDAEAPAIAGQSRQMVEHYARQVNQKKLAAAAVLKWEMAAAA